MKKDREIQKEYRGKHIHYKDRCTFELECVKNCPVNAISVDLENNEWEVDLGKCIFCGRCAESCPNNAIEFSNEYKMYSKDKENLKTKANESS